jgi:hypothetical protein
VTTTRNLTRTERAERYRADNERAAAIILADVARYGGDWAALVQCARLVLYGCPRTRAEWGAAA